MNDDLSDDLAASVQETVAATREIRVRVEKEMEKKSSGIWFMVGGMGMFVVGMVLSATVIGAICGIPMILIGLPMLLFGGFRFRQYQLEGLKDSIRQGIVEGAQTTKPLVGATMLQQLDRNDSTSPSPKGSLEATPQQICPACSVPFTAEAKFCAGCGAARPAPSAGHSCKKCGAPVDPKNRFCRECGAPQAF